ncbi:hypothetical protein HHK36_004766 [Tetracentron sinense]|uniref:Terpene synthase metal-binding domain-containing protein n=1 Tax=Tetracentron sinense TaxID=13715 RepID=A0A834ZLU3_TETSI|nr:hypothetical protein HHK36_004766 [Tetracentron sinense]
MLSLYEASYLSLQGEVILDEARDFTSSHLNDIKEKIDLNLAKQVNHALELPLHWRMLRLEARWFVDIYERREDMNPILLELAKLDYNMVQETHQKDLRDMSRWWTDPDDVYDVYGTLDELELFTDAVERWDINAIEQLLDYMKIRFLALYNSVNEMAYVVPKEQGSDIVSYLKKATYVKLTRWRQSGTTADINPTLEEYLNNAWISISAPVIPVHGYFFVTNPITKEALECLESYPNIIRWSSMILRLCDDLGTSTDELKRGDVPKSIQCYMNETSASEEEAREHIRGLISDTWKKMNEDRVADSPFSQTFIGIAMNLARMGTS